MLHYHFTETRKQQYRKWVATITTVFVYNEFNFCYHKWQFYCLQLSVIQHTNSATTRVHFNGYPV